MLPCTQVQYCKKILKANVTFSRSHQISADGEDIVVNGFLIRDPTQRLGANSGAAGGASDIRGHPFFSSLSWEKLLRKEVDAPIKPVVNGVTDISHFAAELANEKAPEDGTAAAGAAGADAAVAKEQEQRWEQFDYVAE